MGPKTHPKQYQDVKANLAWYTTLVLAIVGLACYFFIVPTGQQEALNTLFGRVESLKIIGPGILAVGFAAIGWFLVFVVEIYDKVYDRRFTKWRFWYDIDFILPTLFRPFANKIDPRFFDEAQKNLYQFMKPYYHFVGDYDTKINKNLVVRFYEAVTKYWMTQINEVLIFFLFLLALVYSRLYPGAQTGVLLDTCFLLVALFILNRYAAQRSRLTARLATSDEIEEIKLNFKDELEDQLIRLSEKFNLRYGKD